MKLHSFLLYLKHTKEKFLGKLLSLSKKCIRCGDDVNIYWRDGAKVCQKMTVFIQKTDKLCIKYGKYGWKYVLLHAIWGK